VYARLIRIGTSGWSYKDWEGVFYKPGENKLQRYCKIFNTVEIDSTFYSYPDMKIVEKISQNTPRNFVFTAKIPSLITHEKKLDVSKGVLKDLHRFLELVKPLENAGKLGPLLIQLPPSFEYSKHKDFLETFLSQLPERYRFSIEFRDNSWIREDVMNMLSRYSVAYTIVDEPLLPPELHITTDFTYIRWHGRGRNPWYYYHYSREELSEWKPKITKMLEETREVYGYFNNHFKGYAVHNALQVLEILEVITPSQRKALEEVEKNLKKNVFEQPKLSIIIPPEKIPENVEDMLKLLTDEARFKRGKEIGRREIEILEKSPSSLSAKIKEYNVFIDVERKIIFHDCADWVKVKNTLSFCKHLVALMLQLEPDYSKKILREIILERASWTFTDYSYE